MALSLAVQYYAKPKIVLYVSKNCFYPKPDVDSAVVRMEVYPPKERPVKAKDPDLMFRLIRAAFNQRRKTLVNALSNNNEPDVSKERILAALEKMDKPATVRGETLTLSEFAELSDCLL